MNFQQSSDIWWMRNSLNRKSYVTFVCTTLGTDLEGKVGCIQDALLLLVGPPIFVPLAQHSITRTSSLSLAADKPDMNIWEKMQHNRAHVFEHNMWSPSWNTLNYWLKDLILWSHLVPKVVFLDTCCKSTKRCVLCFARAFNFNSKSLLQWLFLEVLNFVYYSKGKCKEKEK